MLVVATLHGPATLYGVLAVGRYGNFPRQVRVTSFIINVNEASFNEALESYTAANIRTYPRDMGARVRILSFMRFLIGDSYIQGGNISRVLYDNTKLSSVYNMEKGKGNRPNSCAWMISTQKRKFPLQPGKLR